MLVVWRWQFGLGLIAYQQGDGAGPTSIWNDLSFVYYSARAAWCNESDREKRGLCVSVNLTSEFIFHDLRGSLLDIIINYQFYTIDICASSKS